MSSRQATKVTADVLNAMTELSFTSNQPQILSWPLGIRTNARPKQSCKLMSERGGRAMRSIGAVACTLAATSFDYCCNTHHLGSQKSRIQIAARMFSSIYSAAAAYTSCALLPSPNKTLQRFRKSNLDTNLFIFSYCN